MLVSEVITLAELQTEEDYADATWITYINEALDDLTPIAKIPYTATVTTIAIASGAGTITLSSSADLLTAHELINLYFTPTTPAGSITLMPRLAFSDLLNPGWKLNNTTITLQGLGTTTTVGTATINYYKKLVHVTSTVNDLKTVALLPEQYHPLIVHYCIAKSQQKEEELGDKKDADTAYLQGKQQMAIERMWEMEPHNRALIRQARVSMMVGGK